MGGGKSVMLVSIMDGDVEHLYRSSCLLRDFTHFSCIYKDPAYVYTHVHHMCINICICTFFLFFVDRVSLYSSGCSETYYVENWPQANRSTPVSAY